MNEIINLIGSIGFPIVACLLLWKQQEKTMTFFIETISKQTQLIESIDKRLEILERNEKKEE